MPCAIERPAHEELAGKTIPVRLANALTRNGSHREAIRYCQAALAVPPNPASCSDLGYALWNSGRIDKAIGPLRASFTSIDVSNG
jgi:Flp pilus assembly protein TadD